MAIATDRKTEQMRVLSDVPALVVRALLDDVAGGSDAFADALRRYREEGAPGVAEWRTVPRPTSGHTAEVLRRLARDLLSNVTSSHDPETSGPEPLETPPANVRAIGEARETPALEQASDGTWRPSATIAHADDADASARRRVVSQLRSRYPDLAAAPEPDDARAVRFTNITVPVPGE